MEKETLRKMLIANLRRQEAPQRVIVCFDFADKKNWQIVDGLWKIGLAPSTNPTGPGDIELDIAHPDPYHPLYRGEKEIRQFIEAWKNPKAVS